MATAEPPVIDVGAARAAVSETAARLSALLRSVTRPEAAAVGRWALIDVAMHVSHVIDGLTAVARGGGAMVEDVWELHTLTDMLLKGEDPRTPAEVADRIDAGVAAFLAVTSAMDPDDRRRWLVEGVDLPLPTLICHVLNELVVHGHDVARAQGVRWPVERAHAALVVMGFVFPVLGRLGRALVDQEAAVGRRICFEVRLRGAGRAYLFLDDGLLAVSGSAPVPVDCHLSVDPAAFLLVAWGRLGQWPAITRGQLLAWGRRPWLGLQLRTLLRNL